MHNTLKVSCHLFLHWQGWCKFLPKWSAGSVQIKSTTMPSKIRCSRLSSVSVFRFFIGGAIFAVSFAVRTRTDCNGTMASLVRGVAPEVSIGFSLRRRLALAGSSFGRGGLYFCFIHKCQYTKLNHPAMKRGLFRKRSNACLTNGNTVQANMYTTADRQGTNVVIPHTGLPLQRKPQLRKDRPKCMPPKRPYSFYIQPILFEHIGLKSHSRN